MTTESFLTLAESLPDDLSTLPEENLLRVGFVPQEEGLDEETPDFAGDIKSRMDGWLKHRYHWTPIGKLYRRAYLNERQIRFRSMRIAEDQFFILDNLVHADVYVSQNKCFYIYRIGEVDSISRGKGTPRVFINALRSMFESLEQMDVVFRDEPFFEEHPEYRKMLTDYQVETIEREFTYPKYREFGRELLSRDQEVRKVFTDYFGNLDAYVEKILFDSYDLKPVPEAADYDWKSFYEKMKPFTGPSHYVNIAGAHTM